MKTDDWKPSSTRWLTVSETAKYMGVGRQIVYQLIDFGELSAVRKNRAVLVEKGSVDTFRNSSKLT